MGGFQHYLFSQLTHLSKIKEYSSKKEEAKIVYEELTVRLYLILSPFTVRPRHAFALAAPVVVTAVSEAVVGAAPPALANLDNPPALTITF